MSHAAGFRVLRAAGEDARQWNAVLDRLPAERRDLHYSPEYGSVYRDALGQEPMLAVLERDGSIVVNAFVRRPLNTLPFLAGEQRPYSEVATPYGFGGPLLVGGDVSLLREFDGQWLAWARGERLASEFVCLHPVLGNATAIAESGIAVPRATKEVVVIDLDQPEPALWSAISRGTRSSINRSRREGVEVEQRIPDAPALAQFQAMYRATMARVGAAERWLLPDSYFAACAARLGPRGCALFVARRGGEPAAAFLVIRDARTAYYHFGASDARFLPLRPNNLLMYETLLWAKRQGCTTYHLGGGVTPDPGDSLLRFKSSFGGRRAVLYTYGRVLDDETYGELCEMKRRHERRSGAPVADPDYFPLYRR